MAEKEPSGAEKMFGDFAPALVHFTDDVLFGEVWQRAELTPKERGLVTVAALATNGNTDQLVFHLDLARKNANRAGHEPVSTAEAPKQSTRRFRAATPALPT